MAAAESPPIKVEVMPSSTKIAVDEEATDSTGGEEDAIPDVGEAVPDPVADSVGEARASDSEASLAA